MKKLLLFLTLLTSLVALPPIAGAKDKDKDKDRDSYYDHDKKAWKELRDDIREVREQYQRLSETVRREEASRRIREELGYIGADVQRISAIFDRGNYDYRDLRARVSRLEDSIDHTRDHLKYEQRGRGYDRNR